MALLGSGLTSAVAGLGHDGRDRQGFAQPETGWGEAADPAAAIDQADVAIAEAHHMIAGFELGDCLSIQGPAEPQHGDGHGDQHQDRECGDIEMQDGERSALEHDGADDADEMGERQRLADPLRP